MLLSGVVPRASWGAAIVIRTRLVVYGEGIELTYHVTLVGVREREKCREDGGGSGRGQCWMKLKMESG